MFDKDSATAGPQRGRSTKLSAAFSQYFAVASLTLSCSGLIGCGAEREGGANDDENVDVASNSALFQAARRKDMTSDDHLAEIAKKIPGFGGMYLDQSGTLQVYMTDHSNAGTAQQKAALESVIASEMFDGRPMPPYGMTIRTGKYDFLQLKNWHDTMSAQILSDPTVVYTDIDDANNCLVIGVEHMAAKRAAIESRLDSMGIPRQAIVLKEAAPVHFELQSFHRPLVGGIQTSEAGFICTLGFAATNINFLPGLVTASHCTAVQGGVESTVFHQPTVSGTSNIVGTEIRDPTYFTGGACPATRRCRFSDSAFIQLASGVTTTRGAVARVALNSTVWNGVDLYSNVSNGQSTQIVGQVVTKVGRTTGRTEGTVQSVCANFNVLGSDITQLCQTRASYASSPGDSGAPVFTSVPNRPLDQIDMLGIHWGSGGVFSPAANIQRSDELGTLIIF